MKNNFIYIFGVIQSLIHSLYFDRFFIVEFLLFLGWGSSADPYTSLRVKFDTQEQAVHFAEKHGWKYTVQQFDESYARGTKYGTKKYAFNFLQENVERKLAREGTRTKHFKWPGAGKSNWFQVDKYHGDGEVVQHGPPKK